MRCNLVDCLKNIEADATPLVVLKPLTLQQKADLPRAVDEWNAGIEAMDLPEDRKKTLTELLEYAILQRFKDITLEEIRKMIQLTPLEETVAVKELIQKGMEKGMEKGQLMGQIQLLQRLLKRPQTPDKALIGLGLKELQAMLAKLEADLSDERK